MVGLFIDETFGWFCFRVGGLGCGFVCFVGGFGGF